MEKDTTKKNVTKKIIMVIVGLSVAVFLAWYINTYIYNFFASTDPVNVIVSGPDTVDLKENAEPSNFKVIFNIAPPAGETLVTGFDLVLKYQNEYIDYVSIDKPEWADLITDEKIPGQGNETSRRIVLVATDEILLGDAAINQFPLSINFTTTSNDLIATIEEAEQSITLVYTDAEIVGVNASGQADSFGAPVDNTVKIVKLIRSASNTTPTPEITPAVGDAYLGFSPESVTTEPYLWRSVQLMMNTGGQSIVSTDIYLKYDPDVIEFDTMLPGGFMESVEFNNTNPGVLYISGVTTAEGGKSGEGPVATLVYRGIALAETEFHYVCDETEGQNSSIQLADINATNIISCDVMKDHTIKVVAVTPTPGVTEPTLSPTPQEITKAPNTPTPTKSVSGNDDIKLNMKVRFQGVTKQPAANQDTMDVKVTLSGRNGFSRESTVSFKSDGSGMWSGSMPVSNVTLNTDFAILIKGPKHLAKKICVTNPRESIGGTYKCNEPAMTLKKGDNDIDFSNIILLAGDLPQQNQIVDSVDIVFIRQNFSNKSSDALKRGDLNLDGIIDTQDYALVLAALGFKYDEEL